jgi:purine-binding chemotaxis protein CheW
MKKTEKFILFSLKEQLFCISTDKVEDVIRPHDMTPVPLAPDYVVGILNLRGRIVTAISVRQRLSLPPMDKNNYRGIVLSSDGHLYGLIVDYVTEVVDLDTDTIEPVPDNLSDTWKNISNGVFTYQDRVVILMDTDQLLMQQPLESTR